MSMSEVIDRTQQKVGPIWLTAGTKRYNLYSLMFVAFFSIGLTSFINTFQGYILIENLKIPADDQGSVTSYLSLLQEVIMIALLGPVGALADKIGRKPIMTAGFLLIAFGFFVYPTAGSLGVLFFYRIFYAVGAVCIVSMLATTQGDYPQDSSRGKLIGVCGALQGMGVALAALILLRLPSIYTDMGAENAVWAGRYTLWTAASLALLVAFVVWRGLRPGVPEARSIDEPFLQLMQKGIKAAKNPRVALAYGAAFVSRGDLVIVSSFMTLWLLQVGMSEGLSPQDASKQASGYLALVQTFALLWAPVIGIIIDKMNRVAAIIIAIVLAGIGYINIGLMDNPMAAGGILAAGLLGMGEISGVLASQALIGQEAPNRERGSVFGTFGMFGAIGILIALAVGGQLFDLWRPSAPFLMMGLANVVLLFLAIYVYVYHREPSEEVLAAARGDVSPEPDNTLASQVTENAATEGVASQSTPVETSSYDQSKTGNESVPSSDKKGDT